MQLSHWIHTHWVNKSWVNKNWINKNWANKTWLLRSWVPGSWAPRRWINKNSMKNAAEKLWTMPLMDAAIGALVCSVAALGTIAAAEGHPWKNMVPLVFAAILVVIAALFGAKAGILSTVLAALFFATFLFGPTGSLAIANESARSNLGWMLLIGIGFSFLFAPPNSGFRRH
jgi:K+-sensing histidine kinase KdpD